MKRAKKTKSKFTEGHEAFVARIDKRRFKYISSCESCIHSHDGTLDGCFHPEVIQFDVIVEDDRTYCGFWKCEGQ